MNILHRFLSAASLAAVTVTLLAPSTVRAEDEGPRKFGLGIYTPYFSAPFNAPLTLALPVQPVYPSQLVLNGRTSGVSTSPGSFIRRAASPVSVAEGSSSTANNTAEDPKVKKPKKVSKGP